MIPIYELVFWILYIEFMIWFLFSFIVHMTKKPKKYEAVLIYTVGYAKTRRLCDGFPTIEDSYCEYFTDYDRFMNFVTEMKKLNMFKYTDETLIDGDLFSVLLKAHKIND